VNKLLPETSEHDYRNDRLDAETPTLNASTAKELITRSPLHAWQFHPRLGGSERDGTVSTENGSLIHALVLGAGRKIVAIDGDDFRTKAAKEARAVALEAGQIPVIASKLKFAEATAAVLKRRIADLGVQLDGQSEVTGMWRSPEGVLCRCRFDHLPKEPSDILEFKTCESAHPQAIQRAIELFGYDIAAAAYSEAHATIHPTPRPVRYRWIFAECEPPHAVTIVRFEGTMATLGNRRWSRAKAIWQRCLAEGRWPGYTDGEIAVEASEWAIKRETEIEYNANPPPEF